MKVPKLISPTIALLAIAPLAHGIPVCTEAHCSNVSESLNSVCISMGYGGQPFPAVLPDKSVCSCPCSCVAGDTLVLMSSAEYYLIRDLREADEVYSPYVGSSKISKMMRSSVNDIKVRQVQFSNGSVITASGNHTFVTPAEKIISAEDLKVGQEVRDVNGNNVTVTGNEITKFTGYLYNTIINRNSKLAADHIVVTNDIQSGDWQLQAANDVLEDEIYLRMNVVESWEE